MRKCISALLRILLCLTLAAAIYAGLRLWHAESEAARAESLLQALRADVFPTSAALDESEDSPAPAEPGAHACPVRWDTLYTRCPQAVAWLSGCGGEIDTPIVQGSDNAFFLTHLADGTENMLGASFLDSANRPSFADDQSFIFGHHTADAGGAFAPLLQYREQAYLDAHPAFILHTPYGCYRADVFAACTVSSDFPYYTRDFADTASHLLFFDSLRAASDVLSPTVPVPGDRVLTLCTCVTKSADGQALRYIVCAKLSAI